MSEDIKKENFGNNSQNKSEEKNIGKRTPADIVKETMPSYKNLTYSECYERMKAIRAQLQAIRNPEALKAITNAQKNFENTRKILASILPNTSPLADRYKIQEYVAKVFAAPQVNNAAIAAYQKMGEALQNAAMSDSVKEYQENIQTALTAEKEFSNSRCNSQNEKSSDITKEALKKIGSNVNEENLPERKNQALDLFGNLSFQNVAKKLIDIETLLRNFLRQFKIITLRNERSSVTSACWSKWLAIIAIFISVVGILASGGIQWYFAYRAEKNNRTGELINTVKKSHPWSEQQISADDAKNVSVAFHAIIEALQKNVQLEQNNIQLKQDVDRLQADLSKTQGDLAELQNKYNTDKVAWTQEKQKLYAEIATLKKQMEELKTELAKRPLRKQSPEVEK